MTMANFENNNCEKLFTAKRCLKVFSISTKWKDLKTLLGKNDVTLDKVKTFVKGVEESRDYSKVFFTNKFIVDQPIFLVGVGFYGPFDKVQATYRVYIEVEDSDGTENVAHTMQTIEAKKEEMFTVKFPTCLSIFPCIEYSIRFRLDGPQTCIADQDGIKLKCCVEGVNFGFNANSSQQMPILLFRLSESNGCNNVPSN